MEEQNRWNIFTQTGRVSDYLSYVEENRERATNSVKEEREHSEETTYGHGAVSNDHW